MPNTAARRCWASRACALSATAGRTRTPSRMRIRVAADFASSNMNQRIEEGLREFAKAGLSRHASRFLLPLFLASPAHLLSRQNAKIQSCAMEVDAGTGVGGARRDVLGTSGGDGRSGVAHVFADHSARSDSYDDRFEGQFASPGRRIGSRFLSLPPVRKFDPNFNADTETYEGTQVFLARIELKKDLQPGPVTIDVCAALSDVQRDAVHSSAYA